MKKLFYKLKKIFYQRFVVHFLYNDTHFIDVIERKIDKKFIEIHKEIDDIKDIINRPNDFEFMLIAPIGTSKYKIEEILSRANFFLGQKRVLLISNIAFLPDDVFIPALITKEYDIEKSTIRFHKSIFKIDYESIHDDGWEWHRLINYFNPIDETEVIEKSKRKFVALIDKINREKKEKSYMFGTGPSLKNYTDFKYDDGLKIVCNTIVKDKDTWEYIKPDIFVAADAHYHFDFNELSTRFRTDLKNRLRENPNCFFVYRLFFHSFIMREFAEFENQLIAIPEDFENVYINTDFTNNYKIPLMGNILDLMLIPLACNFSKNIFLLGFDGRKPNDEMFWGYSMKHSYEDLIIKVKDAHPKFFEKHVPVDDPNKYSRVTFMNLDSQLNELEAKGWKFTVLNESTIPGLQKRYLKKESIMI